MNGQVESQSRLGSVLSANLPTGIEKKCSRCKTIKSSKDFYVDTLTKESLMDIERIKTEASGRWFGILDNLGIDVRHDNKHSPCPLCPGGKDRFRMDADGSRYYCNQCGYGDTIALIQKYTGMSFADTVKKISELIGGISMEFKPNKPKKDPSIYLNKVWQASQPLTGIDPVSGYLKSRGITIIPDNVRYCPKCYESETKTEMQAMVARIQNREGKPISLHITYLKNSKKANIASPKKMMMGTENLNRSAVRLSYLNNNCLGVGEGIESVLSASQLFNIPVWACLSNILLESWEPPKECKKIIICGDSDKTFTGQKSAYILANRLYKDYCVEIRIPTIRGQDWNDVVCSERRDYERRK